MTNNVNLQALCRAAGYDFSKLPAGATDIRSNGDGTFTISVNGQTGRYNSDGSVFTAAQSSNSTGNTGSGSIFGASTYMPPIGNFSATSMGYNQPWMSQFATMMQSFSNSMNFDFSHLGATPGSSPSTPVSVAGGETEVVDENGDTVKIDQLAERAGLKTSKTSGIYYTGSGDDKTYYKYDSASGEFIECMANGRRITDEDREEMEIAKADKKAAEERAKEKEEARAAASGLAGNMYTAMKGAGTNDTLLNSTVNQVNKDNVLEMLEVYQDNYSENMKGETLIQSIQDDMSGREEAAVINKIADALCERARELGLNEEADLLRSTLDAEFKTNITWARAGRHILHNLFRPVKATADAYHAIKGTPDAVNANDDVVNAAIMKLANQIKAKEAGVEYVPEPVAETAES